MANNWKWLNTLIWKRSEVKKNHTEYIVTPKWRLVWVYFQIHIFFVHIRTLSRALQFATINLSFSVYTHQVQYIEYIHTAYIYFVVFCALVFSFVFSLFIFNLFETYKCTGLSSYTSNIYMNAHTNIHKTIEDQHFLCSSWSLRAFFPLYSKIIICFDVQKIRRKTDKK